jgi:Tfp pilus assembly protein PilF
MGRIEKTVFLSYRRTHFPWAYCIYQDLTHHGFDVFIDYQSIDSGNFESVILDNIRSRAHFVVILAPSALERCHEPGDWLTREIETAMDEGRNIIPVMLEGFDFGGPLAKKFLTGKLESLGTYNGLNFIAEYMEAGLEKLRKRYLNVPLEDIHLHTLTDAAKEITKLQKEAANQAPSIRESELTAQEWLERGYVYASNGDFDESIRCLTESIRLNPIYEAYYNRGIMRRLTGDFDGAIHDYDEAIAIDPSEAQTYNNRGNVRRDKGDLDGALSDYNEALFLKQDAALVYINRGIVRTAIGDTDAGLADFNEALTRLIIREERAEAFYRRGTLFQFKGQLGGAMKDFLKTINLDGFHFLARASLCHILRITGFDSEADEHEKVARDVLKQEVEYNRACFESILGNTDEALKLLEIGLQGKQVTRGWARKDPDLENIRDDRRFEELVGQ